MNQPQQPEFNKVVRTDEASEFPKVVLIDNCSACNLTCSMCDHSNIKKHRKIQIMKRPLYKKIIDEIAAESPGTRVWEIFFGDPFICNDIADRVRYAKDKGLTDVVVNTNGMLMNEARSRAMIEAGLDAIYVGIDAFSSETYNLIRIGGKLEVVTNNVLSYKKLLDQYGNGKQQLFVQFVVSDINQDEVEPFKNQWASHGINVKIRPKVSWAGLVDATNLLPNSSVNRKPCYWLMQTMSICSDGRVALCAVDVHCRVESGNVLDMSLKELWQKSPLASFRRMHLENRYEMLPEMCRNCSDWQSGYADFEMV